MDSAGETAQMRARPGSDPRRRFRAICAALIARSVVGGALALALAGCATTKVRSSVVQSDRPNPNYRRIMVVVAAAQSETRRALEQALAFQLVQNDVVAVTSWSFFPGKQLPRREDIEPKVREYGVDAVLVQRLVDFESDLKLTSDQIYDVQQFSFYGEIWLFYPVLYSEVSAPERLVGSAKARIQSNLYDAATAKLVWTATSDTIKPRTSGKAGESLAEAVVRRLKSDHMIR